MTVTLSLLSEHAASKYHIGELAPGWIKNDQQPVVDYFMNEVLQLHKPKLCYCEVTNSFHWVSFRICFYLVDRPEHNFRFKLFNHGGATSKQFGHVAIYKPTVMSSCDLFYESRFGLFQKGQPML